LDAPPGGGASSARARSHASASAAPPSSVMRVSFEVPNLNCAHWRRDRGRNSLGSVVAHVHTNKVNVRQRHCLSHDRLRDEGHAIISERGELDHKAPQPTDRVQTFGEELDVSRCHAAVHEDELSQRRVAKGRQESVGHLLAALDRLSRVTELILFLFPAEAEGLRELCGECHVAAALFAQRCRRFHRQEPCGHGKRCASTVTWTKRFLGSSFRDTQFCWFTEANCQTSEKTIHLCRVIGRRDGPSASSLF
jgi:hypothetical protein